MQDSFLDFKEKNWALLKKDLKKIVGDTAYNIWVKQLSLIAVEIEQATGEILLEKQRDSNEIKSITTDNDGKFITTATIPDNFSSERTDFIMTDSGGSEKTVSIRLSSAEKREMSETIKISIGNTPQNAKRGETVIMEGNGTPTTTLTLTTSYQDGPLLGVNTASVGSDGKWSFDFLISPDFDLKKINEHSPGFKTRLKQASVQSIYL